MLKVLLSTCLPEKGQNTREYECAKSRSIAMQKDADIFLGIDVYHAVTAIPVYSIRENEREKMKKIRFIY